MPIPHNTTTLRILSDVALHEVYDSLRADRLPVGTFDGIAWPWSPWLFWRGKVFTGSTVRNRILGRLRVEGHVSLVDRDVVIDYPQLGFKDYLRPVSETLWLGRVGMDGTIWFTLEQAT